jgi:diaminopimelate epimerase
MSLSFVKMQGAGNDFVVLDGRAAPPALTPALLRRLADRRHGVGCDQIVLLGPDPAGADTFMRIFNPDASEAEACGNATRCVAALIAEETGARRVTVRTAAGLLLADILGPALVEVDMGVPGLEWGDIPLTHAADTLHLPLALGPVADPAACSMGNPHATFFVDSFEFALESIGPVLERAKIFPARANVGFAKIEAGAIRLRVWERGAGLTLACGSGACAALVNAARRGLAPRQALVVMDGGELLITWRADDHVLMRGPAETSFTGVFPELV